MQLTVGDRTVEERAHEGSHRTKTTPRRREKPRQRTEEITGCIIIIRVDFLKKGTKRARRELRRSRHKEHGGPSLGAVQQFDQHVDLRSQRTERMRDDARLLVREPPGAALLKALVEILDLLGNTECGSAETTLLMHKSEGTLHPTSPPRRAYPAVKV
jgi:hypothetical protein